MWRFAHTNTHKCKCIYTYIYTTLYGHIQHMKSLRSQLWGWDSNLTKNCEPILTKRLLINVTISIMKWMLNAEWTHTLKDLANWQEQNDQYISTEIWTRTVPSHTLSHISASYCKHRWCLPPRLIAHTKTTVSGKGQSYIKQTRTSL